MLEPRSSNLVRYGGQGRLYGEDISPGLTDAAPSGRVRLDAIARWLQDIAYRDLVDAGLDDEGVWVVRRTRICVNRFPRFGDTLRLETFCNAAAKLCAERRTTMRGTGADIEALTLWVNLQRDGGTPRRLSERFGDIFGPSTEGRRASKKLRHRPPPTGARTGSWHFRAADLDLAGHVNNAVYWQLLEEELVDHEDLSRYDAEIEYRLPLVAGNVDLAREKEMRWLISASGDTAASIRVTGV